MRRLEIVATIVTRLKEAFLFYGSNAGITREIVP
jgi:hypothetical protein